MSTTCGACCFWGKIPLDGRFAKDREKCRIRELELHGIKPCGRLMQTDLYGEGIERHDELAGLEATGGNFAYLFTRSDFGCKYFGAARVRKQSSIRPCKRARQ